MNRHMICAPAFYRVPRVAAALLLVTALSGCGLADRVSGLTSGLFAAAPKRAETAERPVAQSSFEKLAREMLAAGDADAALPLIRRAGKKTPDSVPVALLHGEVALAANAPEESLAAFDRAAALDPDSARAMAGRGVALLSLGRDDDARAALLAAAGAPDAAASVLSNAGLALAMLGDADQSVRVLEQAIAAPDATARTRQNLSLAYALAGDRTRALSMALVDMDRENAQAQLARWSQLSTQAPAARLAFVSGRPQPDLPQLALRQTWHDQAATAALRVIGQQPAAAFAGNQTVSEASAEAPLVVLPVADESLQSSPAPSADWAETTKAPEVIALPLMEEAVSPPAPLPAAQVTRLSSRPALTRTALTVPVPAVKSVTGGPWTIQLGNFSKLESLAALQASLSKQLEASYAAIFGSLRTIPDQHKTGETVLRLVVGSYATAAEAKPVCADMRRNKIDCFVWSTRHLKPSASAS